MNDHRKADGREAEELRSGIESLIEGSRDGKVPTVDLQTMLDQVDARDSLAFIERADALEARLRELRIRRSFPDLFRCEECQEYWYGTEKDERHRDKCIFNSKFEG